jgi:hypothetical protein
VYGWGPERVKQKVMPVTGDAVVSCSTCVKAVLLAIVWTDSEKHKKFLFGCLIGCLYGENEEETRR